MINHFQMYRFRNLVLALCISIIATGYAFSQSVENLGKGVKNATGVVFWDNDGDGEFDKDEQAAADIPLSNSIEIVRTDTEGRFTFSSDRSFLTVSVVLPTGSWTSQRWFRRLTEESAKDILFGLQKEEQDQPFLFVQFSDPHSWERSSQPVLDQMLLEISALPLNPAFYFCTGDMRSGTPTVTNVESLKRSFSAIGANYDHFNGRLFMVPGNHDITEYGGRGGKNISPKIQEHPLFGNRAWETYVCPARWAFRYGGWQFIGLDWADYVEGKWNNLSPGMDQWLRQARDVVDEPTKSVLLAHNPRRGEVMEGFNIAYGFFGHTHTQGQYYFPGSEAPMFGPNVIVSGQFQSPVRVEDGEEVRRFTADGRPLGYTLALVQNDTLHYFYKPLGVDKSILLDHPRRFQAVDAKDGKVRVAGKFFDPEQKVKNLKISVGDKTIDIPFKHYLIGGEFETLVDVSNLEAGFHDFVLTAQYGKDTSTLSEPYLILNDSGSDKHYAGEATLILTATEPSSPAEILFNGQMVAKTPELAEGEEVRINIPAAKLKRLNSVKLGQADKYNTTFTNVWMQYEGKKFYDQHRGTAWGYQPLITQKRALYFDLEYSGPVVKWEMR